MIGDIFGYENPYSQQTKYYQLKALGADGRYWYFPANGEDNSYWN